MIRSFDAGAPSGYAGSDPVTLDGTGSYDPDQSDPLNYIWSQVSGPPVTITGGDTATPTIGDFVQTSEIQDCVFQLVVSDGEHESLPAAVSIVIVPKFRDESFRLHNDIFDPLKPTVIYFGGGNCTVGAIEDAMCPIASPEWLGGANVVSFPEGYRPDIGYQGMPTYYDLGDMILVYLSSVAVDYRESIQTVRWSTGAQPATDVALRLNEIYRDAVNRVTHLDGGCRILSSWGGSWERYAREVQQLLDSAVGGEQCWVDHYWGQLGQGLTPQGNMLAVLLSGYSHQNVRDWYGNSLGTANTNRFGDGLVGGGYWSVIGRGKNLQLSPVSASYCFRWEGSLNEGDMTFYDESRWPGTLPQPVTLLGPIDVGDPNGVVLTCEESRNARAYQLLFGSDKYRVMDYDIVSEAAVPPKALITDLPFQETWWTVRVRDEFGSTIHADPLRIDSFVLSLPIQNITLGRRYGYLQSAIDEARDGDEIVLEQGIYYENIDFRGKSLTVRSAEPNNAGVGTATVITGDPRGPVVTSSSDGETSFVLNGLMITGGRVGIACRGTSPTIKDCTISGDGPVGVSFWYGYPPTSIDCTLRGDVQEVSDPRAIAVWGLDEAAGDIAHDSVGVNDGILVGTPTSMTARDGHLRNASKTDNSLLL